MKKRMLISGILCTMMLAFVGKVNVDENPELASELIGMQKINSKINFLC